jgi:glycosyltransferase 2 family protein
MQIERKSACLAFKVFSISVWILCCAYVAVTIYRTGALQVVSQSILDYTSAFVLVIGLYVLSCLGIAAAFAFLVWGVSAGQRLRADIIGVHAITQVAKYLPTNTLHLIGRHAVLRRRGLSDVALLGAGLGEIVLLLLAAVGLAALGASDELATHLDLDQRSLAIMGAVMVALVLIAAASIRGNLAVSISPFLTWRAAAGASVAISVYCIFFTLSGVILWVLLAQAIQVPVPPDIVRLTSYTAISWSIGFISPGAAAGIGVRETILILLLDGVMEPAPATSTAVAYRLVTTAGDLITCALGGIWWRARR